MRADAKLGLAAVSLLGAGIGWGVWTVWDRLVIKPYKSRKP